MSETAVLWIIGQAIAGLIVVVTAALWIARQIQALRSAHESHSDAMKTGFAGVRTDITRVEKTFSTLEERHEQTRLQMNGISRQTERNTVRLDHHDKDLERLQRAAGGN